MTKRKWTWLQRNNMQRMAEALVVGAAEGGGRGTIAWLDGHDPSSSSLGSREDLSRMTKNDQRSATIDWKISVKSSIIP